MNWIWSALFWSFWAVCFWFHCQDALRQHEALLRMTPTQQAEQLKIWDEESDARTEHEQAILDAME